MLTAVFLACVATASLMSLFSWRLGVTLWVVFAILQEPIRKITPGAPPYLTLSFLPIYLAAFLGLCSQTTPIRNFRRTFPQLAVPLTVFVVCIAMSFIRALSYGPAFVPSAVLGVFSYAGGIPAVVMGFHYLRRGSGELDRLLWLYIFVTCVMLIGVPLESMGVKFSAPWLGTIAREGEWRRWYSPTEWVVMISGFYRSPEIMGWHAMAMVTLSLYLMSRKPQLAWVCLATSVWGAYGVLLSGRRKMYLMVLVFLISYLLTMEHWRRSQLFVYLLIVLIVAVPILVFFVDDGYLKTAETGLAGAGARAAKTGLGSTLWLLGIVGAFGFGVGTKTQGAQHLFVQVQVPLVEGGFEKVLVELGLVGSLGAVVVALSLAALGWEMLRLAKRKSIDVASSSAYFSFVLANLSAFLVAFQFFGDPFVVTFLGFFAGLLFSTARLAAEQGRGPAVASVSPRRRAPARPLPLARSPRSDIPAEEQEGQVR